MSDETQIVPAQAGTPPAPTDLITLDQKTYVTQVYQSFRDRLAEIKGAAADVAYDIKTTAGMKTAVEWRAKFRDLRIEAEKERKMRKAPILDIGKLLDSRYKEFEADVEPLEQRFDADIKAEETRKEAEKAERARIEQERVEGIQKRIADMRAMANLRAGITADAIDGFWHALTDREISVDEFAEFTEQAQRAKSEALAQLHQAYEDAAAREAESARFAAERAELERLRAEAAERDRAATQKRDEEERQAKAALEAEEAKLRAEREAQESELRRQREELVRQQAELDRQRREQQEAADRARREEEVHAAAAQREQETRELEEAARKAETERLAAEKAARRARGAERPSDEELIEVIANHYDIEPGDAAAWLSTFVLQEIAA